MNFDFIKKLKFIVKFYQIKYQCLSLLLTIDIKLYLTNLLDFCKKHKH